MFIPVILGTARESRESEQAALFMLERVKETGVETELIDVRDYLFKFTENPERKDKKERFAGLVTKADGFVIVSPEYNHGYPGELKMLLDELYPEFARKALGICGVSDKGMGGGRMVEQLRLVSIAFRMAPINNAVYFRNVKELFDENGKIKDETYYKQAEGFLKELLWFTEALKNARDKDEK